MSVEINIYDNNGGPVNSQELVACLHCIPLSQALFRIAASVRYVKRLSCLPLQADELSTGRRALAAQVGSGDMMEPIGFYSIEPEDCQVMCPNPNSISLTTIPIQFFNRMSE